MPFLQSPHRVLVIGGGVVGITSAIGLRQAGFQVTVVAEKYEHIATNVAGALWEWPPAVCGRHGDPRSLAFSKHWCMVSYDKFKQFSAAYGPRECGVYLRDVFFYFRKPLEQCATECNKMHELKDKVDGFARGMHIIPPDVDQDMARTFIKDCYKHMAPMVDTDTYLPWLQQKARDMGCVLLRERIDGHILLNEQALRERYDADAIVACPGLGAIGLLGDTQMFPLRGALVRVKQTDGVVTAAHCISHEEGSSSEQDIVFIVPRGDKHVILGGLVQPDRWDYDLSLNDPIIRQMYDGCLGLLPALRDLEIDDESVRTGLRPVTKHNVILDRVPGSNVVLNYGHGGSGVTLSWGCADQVVSLVHDIVHGRPSTNELAHNLHPTCPTTFILQDMLPFQSELTRLQFMKHNLVLICSRRGVVNIPAHEFNNFDLIRIVDEFEFEPIVAEIEDAISSAGLYRDRLHVATNDESSIMLCGRIRNAFGMDGPGARALLPFCDKNAMKKAIGKGSRVRTPRYTVFDRASFESDADAYVRNVVATVGDKLFIKPVVGTGSAQKWRVDGEEGLMQWCTAHAGSAEMFEIDERISGEEFSTTIVRVDGKNRLFFAMRHNRPTDDYFYGHNIGGIVVPPADTLYDRLKSFSEDVLDEVGKNGAGNGVYNVELFVEGGTGEAVLIDVAARAAGVAASKMIEECCGVGIEETSLLLQMGHSAPLQVREGAGMTQYAAYSLHAPKQGVVKRMRKPELDSTVSSLTWKATPGQTLSAPASMSDASMLIVISNPDLQRLESDFEAMNGEEYVIYE